MDPSVHLSVPKADIPEIPDDFDWFNDYPLDRLLDLPPLDSLHDFNDLTPQLQSFDDLFNDSYMNRIHSFPELIHEDSKPKETEAEDGRYSSDSVVQSESVNSNDKIEESSSFLGNGRAKKSCELEMDEIRKYFDRPITKAAKEMKVGLTVLKKRCRELNIMRWPYRKIKSLKALINHHKEEGISEEIVMLEEHKRLIEHLPDMELTQRTKKLRQASFKSNYKKRRILGPSP